MGRGSRGPCATASVRLRLADNLYGNDLATHVRFLRKKQRLLATLANPWTDSNFLYPEIKGLQDLVAAPSASQAAQDGLYGIVHQCARDIEGLLNAAATAASVGEGGGHAPGRASARRVQGGAEVDKLRREHALHRRCATGVPCPGLAAVLAQRVGLVGLRLTRLPCNETPPPPACYIARSSPLPSSSSPPPSPSPLSPSSSPSPSSVSSSGMSRKPRLAAQTAAC